MDMTQSPMLKAADFDFSKEAGAASGGMQGATTWTPSDNAMAANQLTKLLQTDNKLMQQARSRAGAASARRGLMNSSIGVEAGESAAMGVALPLAQQDASTYAQSEQFNAGAANDFARDNNSFGRNAALTKYQGILAQESQGRDMAWRSGENALERDFQGNQAQLGREFQTSERIGGQEFSAGQAQIGRDFESTERGLDRTQQTALQQNNQDWQAKQNELNQKFQMDFEKFRLPMNMMANFTDKMQSFVTQIMSDPNLDANAKDQAIANYYSYSRQTMGWMSSFFGSEMPNMGTPTASAGSGQSGIPNNVSPAQYQRNKAGGLPDDFNPEIYLRNNPDVAAAVQAGQMTAEEHWQRYGKNEERRNGTWNSS
ncbi:MAG: hypothetical protein ACK5PF_05765, partial [bacterium]